MKRIVFSILLLLLAMVVFQTNSQHRSKSSIKSGRQSSRGAASPKSRVTVEGSEEFTVNGVTFIMVPVEGGTFTMGATSEQGRNVHDWEKPSHKVTVSSYFIGQTEVTQELWLAVMGENPSFFSTNNGYATSLQRPVESVNWYDCQEFIKKLNKLTGKKFRLPTEAEWEFAARGGTKSKGYKYSGSNTVSEVGWENSSVNYKNKGTSNYGPRVVASKRANELGIYDMSGNVDEWCADWLTDYTSSPQTDPCFDYGSTPVLRGGSWIHPADQCRVSNRGWYSSRGCLDFLGLRLAL